MMGAAQNSLLDSAGLAPLRTMCTLKRAWTTRKAQSPPRAYEVGATELDEKGRMEKIVDPKKHRK